MERHNEKRTLSLSEYDRLCREAREGFIPCRSREESKERLWFRIGDHIYKYFGQSFLVASREGVTNVAIYRANIRDFVTHKQSEEFDALEIAEKYINETLNKTYS